MLSLAVPSLAQESKPQEPKLPEPKEPQVRVTYLNVCTPGEVEQKEMAAALARIPLRPRLADDYEVSRGRSSMPRGSPEQADLARLGVSEIPVSRWVRLRHDFPPDSPFGSVQYTLSADGRSFTEFLVLRLRDSKDVMQVSLEDSVTGAESAASLLATDTPVNRIKMERFGKSSLGLSRCRNTDQSPYEPLFRSASGIMAAYRGTLRVRRIVPGELARLGAGVPAKKPARKSKPGKK
jgi:hypothetical protein